MTPPSDERNCESLKLHSTNETGLYYYFNSNNEKLWMYRHKYYDNLGNRREKKKSGFKNEKKALKALLEIKAATISGNVKLFENDQITVSEWLDIWYDTNKNNWKVTTRTNREATIRIHLKPLLGKYKLQKLDKSTYRRVFINVLEEKFKPSSVLLFHTIFKIAINAAVEEEILDRNRFTKVPLLGVDETEEKAENYFTPSELVTFLEAAKRQESITSSTLFLTIAFTGIRRGEAFGLQWKNIDFDNKTITVERTRDRYNSRPPKTKNSYRTIMIDDNLIKQLKTYNVWCKKTMLANGLKYSESSFVFIDEESGNPCDYTFVYYAFNKIINESGLPSVTLHGLRHTHATILLNRGLNVKVIAERLGNTPQMIYETYGHVLKELEVQAVALFGASLEESGAKTGANHS